MSITQCVLSAGGSSSFGRVLALLHIPDEQDDLYDEDGLDAAGAGAAGARAAKPAPRSRARAAPQSSVIACLLRSIACFMMHACLQEYGFVPPVVDDGPVWVANKLPLRTLWH